MKIIDRYILNEMLAPFGLTIFIFSFVILVNKGLRLAQVVLNKGVGLGAILKFFFYLWPLFLVFIIPSALLVATLVAFGRLAADRELTAITAAGISFYRILLPVGILATTAFLISLGLSIYVVPRSCLAFRRSLYEMAQAYTLNIKEKTFIDEFEGLLLYVEQVEQKSSKLAGILISDYRQQPPYLILAQQGQFNIDPEQQILQLELQQGSMHQFAADDCYRQASFSRYQLRLDLTEFLGGKKRKKREQEMSIGELREKIKRKKARNENYYSQLIEIYKKFSLPFACLLVGLVGAPLGSVSATGNKAASFALGILIIFVYYIMLTTGETISELSQIHPGITTWIPNLFLLATGSYLTYRVNRYSWTNLLDTILPFKNSLITRWRRGRKV